MAILKCKMCGGDLSIQDGMTVAECEYCGSKQTVPTADNEKKMTLFARANRLRAACEFDKAAGVYESIVAEFPEEAEAYWGLLLCKFGIEYVDDPATGKKIPTCHRSSFDSIMDDSDFEQVMENADAISRRVYREEAKQIEELRKSIIEVSSKEEPYDIFICYKETDENGGRTIDSVIAQDVYDALTEKGYKVFFSRITLEDKLGQEYEPYIFAALNSAKVMLAVGTNYDYYNAVWVKNEWSRFLALIAKGEKKTLIPCYKDIDAYDIPKEFKHLQAQDMGKVGAMQDLLRGIAKILGLKKQVPSVSNDITENPNVTAMIQRGNMALEDGDFDGAVVFFERALDANPKAAYAYLGKFLAFHRLTSLNDLQDIICAFDNDREFKRAEQFADPELAKELKEVRDSNELKIQRLRFLDVIRKGLKQAEIKEKRAAEIEEKYIKACSLQDSAEENQLVTASKMFKALKGYKDSAERLTECEQTYKERKAEREAREEKEQKKLEENKKRLLAIRERIAPYHNTISARWNHTVGLKSDGTVVAIGENKYGQCDVTGWTDIVAVSAGEEHTVGLKADGTVVATKYIGDRKYYHGKCDVQNWRWTDIVAVSAGWEHTVGLKADGTVVATEYIGDWYDSRNQSDKAKDWTDIVAVSVGYKHTVGLKADGTVIDTENWLVKNWTDIVAVSAGYEHTVGLKSDGTVVAVGRNDCGQCNVSGWTDIVAVSAGVKHTVGIKADGTVVATEYTGDQEYYDGQCDVQYWGWEDIVAVSAGYEHTIGLKADGTVVAVGNTRYRQCAVSKWKLFKPDTEKYTEACRLQDSGSIDELKRAAEVFICLGNYKDSAERAITCNSSVLNKYNQEKAALQTELANLKGFFTGKRRKQIEARLAEIESELKIL